MGIRYVRHEGSPNLIVVKTPTPHIFFKCRVPFNNDTFNVICKKKHLTYSLLKDFVLMPRTKIIYEDKSKDIEDIKNEIVSEYSFPLVVKTNSGLMGQGVFLCKGINQVHAALENIFSVNNRHYDGIALAQEFISYSSEYRVVVFMNKVMFVYKKTFEGQRFSEVDGSAYQKKEIPVLVEDVEIINKISSFVESITKATPLEFSGIDLVQDSEGRLVLLELNTHPGFTDFIKECGTKQVEDLYHQMLQRLLKIG